HASDVAADSSGSRAERPSRARTVLGGLLGAAAALVLLGPRPAVPAAPPVPELPGDLEGYLRARESGVPGLRAEAAAAIEWHDSAAREPTALSVVYLHGFSADRHEIDPVPARVAEALGANAFYARLAGRGADEDALGGVGVGDWFADAAEAMAVGRRLGDRVVVVATSTGGTLALWMALQEGWGEDIAALVLVSPNLGLADPAARVLTWPWGGVMVRMLLGPYRSFESRDAAHWTTRYPSRALVPMAALVREVWKADLGAVETPVLVLYSQEDTVLDSRRTVKGFERLGSEVKRLVEVTGPGDPQRHVLAGDVLSPETTDAVVDTVVAFLRELPGGGA
ncbi:MAG: lysophospholipase, partial [Gemmatimonadota bacterium]|nr:lysophospholipase [Gemmatimonadota bacterium]